MVIFKKMNPLVSVIIPTYNREKYIKRAIDSVLLQSFQNFEIIIIDDGSIDNTKDIIANYLKDSRFKYIYQNNQGVSVALDNGIKKSKGKYVSLLHSDDYWCNVEKLKKQVDFLEKHQDFFLVGGGIVRIKENKTIINKTLYPSDDQKIREFMLFSCLFASSTVVFVKKAYLLSGGFDEKLKVCEDWDLWLRLGTIGKFYNFNEYFAYYQESDKSLSNSFYKKSLKNNIEIVKKYRNNYPFFKKALLLRFFYYLYSFIPFNHKLLPIFSKFKRIIFGKPVYIKK
ncbi:MAG: hypothetical protein A2561_02525 [Candidatus Staskawiczbacteria bacterium RIFOXYD1_FULL_32_13]|uniref:Glycosyltransferase 2-like domain-containing protein n=1 Tax=Candidatus Staskawiczbacteria bacterium RIFOXYD1_FULL_32_13 TaxID=1802234 RepID=A0A1G2JQR0_9BACT|nr:MAG: hypothetical protein A2561_02525 [Candidatus Staskawiczbacteria bacterium RIFOXYD1_FULL_32_13]